MPFDPKTLLLDLPPLANDPQAFSMARKEILQQHFAALDASRRAPISELQSEIESASAIAGTPVRALSAILVMLEQRLQAIKRLEQAGREILGDARK